MVQPPEGGYYRMSKLKKWVKSRLKVGNRFMAPADLYNYDVNTEAMAPRIVVEFYENYVLTVDEYGRSETFMWFALYEILHEQEKKENESKKNSGNKDGSV